MPTRRDVVAELLIVTALAAALVGFFPGRPGYVDVVLGIVAVGLIGFGSGRSRRIWEQQPPPAGAARLRRAAYSMLAFTALVALLLLIVGIAAGYSAQGWSGAWSRISNWHVFVAMGLYFPWALLQQFVFQFYLLGRLLYVLPARPAVGLTALAFSAVHFPRWPVMTGTAIAGIVWALTYRRYRVLSALAVSHAVLGSALHYWVFGRDLLGSWFL